MSRSNTESFLVLMYIAYDFVFLLFLLLLQYYKKVETFRGLIIFHALMLLQIKKNSAAHVTKNYRLKKQYFRLL